LKKIAYILFFVFLTFIVGPTTIALIDDSVDVSFAFTANEEENSSKNLSSFETVIEDNYSNHVSIEYLKSHQKENFSYTKNYYPVYLEVISPPPKSI